MLNLASSPHQQKPAHTGPVPLPQTPRKAHESSSSYFGSPYNVTAGAASLYASPAATVPPGFLSTPQRGTPDQPSTPLRAATVAGAGPGTTPASRRCLGLAGYSVGVSSPLAATPHAAGGSSYEFQTAGGNLSQLPASPMSATATAGYYTSDQQRQGDVVMTETLRSEHYATAGDSGYQPMTPASCLDYRLAASQVGYYPSLRHDLLYIRIGTTGPIEWWLSVKTMSSI